MSDKKALPRIQILVLGHSWAHVGAIRDTGRESGMIEVLYAHNIRRYGTSKGIGELWEGPLSSTVLDPLPSIEGILEIPYHSLVFAIDCKPEKWYETLYAAYEKAMQGAAGQG